MIDIYLFSKNSSVLSCFSKIRKSRTFSVVIYNPINYKSILRNASQNTFVYMDISSFKGPEQLKLINYITRQRRFDFGIIDPGNSIKDPADLFFRGASDYLGKSAIAGEVETNRIKSAVNFYSIESVDEEDSQESDTKDMPSMLSGQNWDHIKPGGEYTFCMLFIEIDILPEWEAKSGKDHIDEVMESFYGHLHKIITPLNGKLWIKTDYGGLVLFPYNGSCTSIIFECIKIILNRIIISAEEYSYRTLLTYRLALDIGKTKYLASGNTDNIISDSVNFIFHLGKKYAQSGNFYLTGNVQGDIPPGLTENFLSTERFEERSIYRMKLPVLK